MADRIFTATISAALAVGLSACQPQTTAGDDADPPPAQARSEPLSVREIVAGPAGEVEALRPVVAGDSVEVRLRTTGIADGAELQVKLIALADGSLVGDETIGLDASSGYEHAIGFARDIPWEPGRYLIEATLDGELAGHQELEIQPDDIASPED